MRKEITEAQITELMRAIPRAEEVDRLRAENERLRRFAESVSASGPDDDNIVWVRIDLPAKGGHAAIAVARPISKNIALQLEAIRRGALGIKEG